MENERNHSGSFDFFGYKPEKLWIKTVLGALVVISAIPMLIACIGLIAAVLSAAATIVTGVIPLLFVAFVIHILMKALGYGDLWPKFKLSVSLVNEVIGMAIKPGADAHKDNEDE